MREPLENPGRRGLLAAALLPELEQWLQKLQPRPDSFSEWFNAIRADDVRRVRALLARGFDPNSIEPERFDTGLILAIRHRSRKVFALLLETDGVRLDARSLNGDTALMVSAFLSDTAMAIALIEKGAGINQPGWTALHYAAASGNLTIIRRLLDEAAYIDAESPNRSTPLMMAARSGHRDAVRLLLDEGADVSLKNEAGLRAADFARTQGHGELARLLDAALERDKARNLRED